MAFDIELVGKIGSMALINTAYNDINYNIIARLSRELAPGYIWVTSGATEIGRLDYIKRNGREIAEGTLDQIKSEYSAQGQSILMETYRKHVNGMYSLRQILVEQSHFNDANNREYLRRLLLRAPAQNAIPVINYNDPMDCEENRKNTLYDLKKKLGKVVECVDNDETASQISLLVKSRLLVLLTCVNGIYRDPSDPSTLIEEIGGKDIYELIDNVTECQKNCVGKSRELAGGAGAKLEYIKEPLKAGTTVIIANGAYYLSDVLSGKVKRTIIRAR